MFRTQNRQVSIWEAVFPEQARLMPRELALVDALSDEAAFWEPFRPFSMQGSGGRRSRSSRTCT